MNDKEFTSISVRARAEIADILRKVLKADSEKRKEIRHRSELVERGGYSPTSEYHDVYNEVVSHLQRCGMTVRYFFDCGDFVDAGIIVTWEDVYTFQEASK